MRMNFLEHKEQQDPINSSVRVNHHTRSLPRKAKLASNEQYVPSLSCTLARAGKNTARKSHQQPNDLGQMQILQASNQSPQPTSPPSLLERQVKICLSPENSSGGHYSKRTQQISRENAYSFKVAMARDSLGNFTSPAPDYFNQEPAHDVLSLNDSRCEARYERLIDSSTRSLRRQPHVVANKRHYKQPQSMNKLFPADFFATKKKESRGNCMDSTKELPINQRSDLLPFNLPDASTSLLCAEQRLSSANTDTNSQPKLSHFKRSPPPTTNNCISGEGIIQDHFPMPIADINLNYSHFQQAGNDSLRLDVSNSPDVSAIACKSDADQSYNFTYKNSLVGSINHAKLQKNTIIPPLPNVAPPSAPYQRQPMNPTQIAGTHILQNPKQLCGMAVIHNKMSPSSVQNKFSSYNYPTDSNSQPSQRQVIALPLTEINSKQSGVFSEASSPTRCMKPPIAQKKGKFYIQPRRNSTNDSKKTNPDTRFKNQTNNNAPIPKAPIAVQESRKRLVQSNQKKMNMDERFNISNSCCLQPQQLHFQNIGDETNNSYASMAFDDNSTEGNMNQIDTNSSAGTENAIFDFPTFYGNQDYFQPEQSLQLKKNDDAKSGEFKLPDLIAKKRSTLAEKSAIRRSRCINIETQQNQQQDATCDGKFSTTFSEMNSHCSTNNDDSSSLMRLAGNKHVLSSSLDIDVSLSREEINTEASGNAEDIELRAQRESVQTPCFNKHTATQNFEKAYLDESPPALFIQESCTESQETQETIGKYSEKTMNKEVNANSLQLTQSQMQGIVNRMQAEAGLNLNKVIKFVAEGQAPMLKPKSRRTSQINQKQVLSSRQ